MAEFVSRGPLRRVGMTDCWSGSGKTGSYVTYHGNGPVPRLSLSVTAAAWIDTACMLSLRSHDIFRRKAERGRGRIFVVARQSSGHLLTDLIITCRADEVGNVPNTRHVAWSHDMHTDIDIFRALCHSAHTYTCSSTVLPGRWGKSG